MQKYEMFALQLPPFDANIVWHKGSPRIFDILRKRYVSLTPEEWVRQHFVHYLMADYIQGISPCTDGQRG